MSNDSKKKLEILKTYPEKAKEASKVVNTLWWINFNGGL